MILPLDVLLVLEVTWFMVCSLTTSLIYISLMQLGVMVDSLITGRIVSHHPRICGRKVVYLIASSYPL
jgi:hypothetical protein